MPQTQGLGQNDTVKGLNHASLREINHWPCGHERTPENTQAIGSAGVRCRECRKAIALKSYRKRRSEGWKPKPVFGLPMHLACKYRKIRTVAGVDAARREFGLPVGGRV